MSEQAIINRREARATQLWEAVNLTPWSKVPDWVRISFRSAADVYEAWLLIDDGEPLISASAWGDSPYDCKTPAEVVHDYAVVRGDLSQQYARDQLARWIERYAQAATSAALAPTTTPPTSPAREQDDAEVGS